MVQNPTSVARVALHSHVTVTGPSSIVKLSPDETQELKLWIYTNIPEAQEIMSWWTSAKSAVQRVRGRWVRIQAACLYFVAGTL